MNAEWYIDTEQGSYMLHLGNHSFVTETGVELADGKQCKVEGFYSGEDIAVISITVDGKTYRFRNQDGTPLWAGSGNKHTGLDETGRLGRWNKEDAPKKQYGRNDEQGNQRSTFNNRNKSNYRDGSRRNESMIQNRDGHRTDSEVCCENNSK